MKVYRNGTVISTLSGSIFRNFTPRFIYSGGMGITHNQFNGAIDDVFIYNNVLSE